MQCVSSDLEKLTGPLIKSGHEYAGKSIKSYAQFSKIFSKAGIKTLAKRKEAEKVFENIYDWFDVDKFLATQGFKIVRL
jgi:hypothetical protein